MYNENKEIDQERLPITLSLYKSTGQVIFPEQMSIYNHLALRLNDKKIFEVGCGIGLGTALMSMNNIIIGTDKLQANVLLSRALYPWVQFEVFDITQEAVTGFDVVVCIDVIEHIKNYKEAISNLVRCGKEVWISTPNRNSPTIGKEAPNNDFHVKEFTPAEMLGMIGKDNVKIYTWKTFSEVDHNTMVTPLVYKI